MSDTFKIAVSVLDKKLKDTSDHIWLGILKRYYWDKKYTLAEWKAIIEEFKAGKRAVS